MSSIIANEWEARRHSRRVGRPVGWVDYDGTKEALVALLNLQQRWAPKELAAARKR